MTEKFLIDHRGGIATLTFNRPEIRNALDMESAQMLWRAVEAAAQSPDIRVIVITGSGGAFGSGADMRAALMGNVSPADAFKILTEAYAPAIRAIWDCPLPVIAAVDGPAAGISCDVALACDLRLVSSRGVFMESFIRTGLIPDGGGTFMLPRLVGLGRALEMMFTGDKVEAEEALRIGLANKVFPIETFETEVRSYAERLASSSPQALMLGKRAMKAALMDHTLAEAMAREAETQYQILLSEDGFEGFAAFLEKRTPVWKWKKGG